MMFNVLIYYYCGVVRKTEQSWSGSKTKVRHQVERDRIVERQVAERERSEEQSHKER